MLETIREFGLERLAECGEDAATRDRHATYFCRVCGDDRRPQSPSSCRQSQKSSTTWSLEYPNLRAALSWLRERGDISRLLELSGALIWFWARRVAAASKAGSGWQWGLAQDARSTDAARAAGQLALCWFPSRISSEALSPVRRMLCAISGNAADVPQHRPRLPSRRQASRAVWVTLDWADRYHRRGVDRAGRSRETPWAERRRPAMCSGIAAYWPKTVGICPEAKRHTAGTDCTATSHWQRSPAGSSRTPAGR